MEGLDYWRLCEELTIVQAALLVVGEDPGTAEYAEDQDIPNRPKGYEAVKTAICAGLKNFVSYAKEYDEFQTEMDNLPSNIPEGVEIDGNPEYLSALLSRSIEGVLVPQVDFDINGNNMGAIEGTVDVCKSTLKVDSLKQWLRIRGLSKGFFFPDLVETMDYLDPSNPRYAPKLAASVRAWQAVTNVGKGSPKQALNKWLRENAAEFNLTNEEGKPVEQAITECSKVANWKLKGGAPSTPS